ncbi:MAG: RadC family protein [Oscillospiraceae bacterium]
MRKRFTDAKGEDFNEHELLELLLFNSIPRGDTNAVAHELINTFGGIKEVFDASIHDLKKVKGIGERSAILIKLAQKLAVSYIKPDNRKPVIMCDSETAGAYLVPKYIGAQEEIIYMLSLDGKGKLLSCDEVHRGSINSADINFRKVVEIAIAKRAVGVIIAHNHPSGVAMPSPEDSIATRELKRALALLNVTLLDHIIVADSDWVSMADSGLVK